MTSSNRDVNVLIMAGGEASRLHGLPKATLKICGEPVVERVAREARRAFNGKVYVSVSLRDTSLIGRLSSVEWIVTWGEGYSRDLAYSLHRTGFPVLVLPGDMPFLDHRFLRRIVNEARETPWSAVSITVPTGCRGLEGKEGYTGIGFFKDPDLSNYGSLEICSYPQLLDIDTMRDYYRALGECM